MIFAEMTAPYKSRKKRILNRPRNFWDRENREQSVRHFETAVCKPSRGDIRVDVLCCVIDWVPYYGMRVVLSINIHTKQLLYSITTIRPCGYLVLVGIYAFTVL